MTRSEILAALSGAIVAGYLVAALLFLRFWRETHDRLFRTFAAAFGLLAVQRLALTLTDEVREERLYLYLVRLAAYLLILWAIVEKNRADAR